MKSLNEVVEVYGSAVLGQPPSACYSACGVMHDQIPRERKDPDLHQQLEAFRLAATTLVARELEQAGAIDEVKADIVARKAELLGFAELSEGMLDQVFECAKQIAAGQCRILDITVRSVNNVPCYSVNPVTLELFRNADPGEPQPDIDLYGPENIDHLEIADDGSIQDHKRVKPPKVSNQELGQEITRRLRGSRRA